MQAIAHPCTTSMRARELFQRDREEIYRHTDKLFANLMIFQWLAGIGAALVVSPRTWVGVSSQTHWHVWAAIFLGGAISSLPIYLAWKQPGRALTRHDHADLHRRPLRRRSALFCGRTGILARWPCLRTSKICAPRSALTSCCSPASAP